MQDPNISTMKSDTVKTGASTIMSGSTEDVGSTTAHAATHTVEGAAGKRGIDRRNASVMSGGTMKGAPATTTEESGSTRSAHSSSTTGARGWSISQLPRIARSALPGGREIGDRLCSRGSNTHHHADRAVRHPSGPRRRNPAGCTRNATS